MRSVFVLSTMMAFTAFVQAQDPVMQIGSYGFLNVVPESDDVQEAAMLTSITNELLGRNTRIAVINRKVEDLLDKERNENLNPEFIRGKIAKQGAAMGATHQLVGIVTACNVTEHRNYNPNGTSTVSYQASVTFEVSLIDQATGQNVGGSKTYTVTGGSGLFGGIGPEGALNTANKRAKRKIANWLMTVLPSDLRILKVTDSTSKGFPKQLMVKGGSNIGMTKGEDLIIVEFETVDGVAIENTIAELNVTEVKTESSECKVRKGGEELKAKRDAKAELKILFKPEKE